MYWKNSSFSIIQEDLVWYHQSKRKFILFYFSVQQEGEKGRKKLLLFRPGKRRDVRQWFIWSEDKKFFEKSPGSISEDIEFKDPSSTSKESQNWFFFSIKCNSKNPSVIFLHLRKIISSFEGLLGPKLILVSLRDWS